jgi:hypothetical protein
MSTETVAAVEPENPFAGQGSVLLDIGEDIGAVVVEMPARLEGVEVEIRPAEDGPSQGHHPHVAVVSRPVEGGQLPSLVFPEVRTGTYGLYVVHEDVRRLTVTVAGGEVTSAQWEG